MIYTLKTMKKLIIVEQKDRRKEVLNNVCTVLNSTPQCREKFGWLTVEKGEKMEDKFP